MKTKKLITTKYSIELDEDEIKKLHILLNAFTTTALLADLQLSGFSKDLSALLSCSIYGLKADYLKTHTLQQLLDTITFNEEQF